MKHKIVGTILLIYSLLPGFMFAQAPETGRVIQGTVTSNTDGETLIGVNIVEMDDLNRVYSATITDMNGHFVIKVKSTANKLHITFIGFNKQVIDIGDRSTIDIVMVEDVQQIEEFVVTGEQIHNDGMISIPKREISTAVQSISAETFEGVQVTSIDDALQGRIAGLDIVASSGDLGAGTTMRIRGTSSINAGANPLIVVNQVPWDLPIDPNFDFANANQEQFANMLSINPDDIQEITVLKDAASTAIWGSQGANGVIVIKTKRGLRGPTRVQYSYRLTGAMQPEGLSMLSGDDYTMMMKQAYFNAEQNEVAANVREFLYDKSWSEYENFNNNTNWVDEVTQIGFQQNHYLNVSGGGERARYRVSTGYDNQTGTVIGQKMDRISFRSTLDYNVSDRIMFSSELAFTYTDNQRSWRAEASSNRSQPNELSLLGIAYRKMPNVGVYQQDLLGHNTDIYYNISRESFLHPDQRDLRNPIALAYKAENRLENIRILPTFRLQYDLLDPNVQTLRFNGYVAFDVSNDKKTKFLPRDVSNVVWNDNFVNLAESSDAESMTVRTDLNLTYRPKLSNPNHGLLLYAGYQATTGNRSSMDHSNTNLPEGITEASSAGYLNYIGSSTNYQYRSNAILARGHYTFKERYIFDVTYRRDGSTKFGENNKFGNFPGVSAKWIITDEPFMHATSKWLSMLAVRPSWGISGNQPQQEYLHFSRYANYSSYIDMPASRPSSLQLSDLRWETTTSLNYGFDLGFFDDRYVFDINFYDKRTEDLLFKDLQVPSSSGYGNIPVQNVGTMDNNGWELNFYTNNAIKVKDLRIDFNFNLSNYVNTIVKLREDVLNNYNGDYDYNNGTYLSRLQEGNSFGSIYGFRFKGVYQYNDYIEGVQESAPVARDENGNVFVDQDGDPLPMYFAYDKSNEYEFRGGDAIYEDINYDGNIDELDIVYLGNSNPKVNGGFGTNIRWKQFGLSAFFNFRYGNKIVNAARMNAENMYTVFNQSTAVNWRWRKDGDVTDMPRALYSYGYNWLGSDRYVEDGSFVRLKYLTLTYAVPKKTLQKYKIEQLNFYVTINNLFVLTKYTGVDPEVGYGSFGVSQDNAMTPRSKDCTLNLSITF